MRALWLAVLLTACDADETMLPAGASSSDSTTGAGGSGGEGGASVVVPQLILPRSSLDASELGVIFNSQDPQSVQVANHYRAVRDIPEDHVYALSFPVTGATMSAADFAAHKASLDARVDPSIQAYAITWTQPYAVDCMSVTAAFALGYDTKYCNTTGDACGPTAYVPYFDSSSFAPFTDHGIRPAMVLVGATTALAEAVINRGAEADQSFPAGDGFFLRTTDVARSVRWPDFVETIAAWPEALALSYLDNSAGAGLDHIARTDEVLFYFTGLVTVPAIDTNTYLPGAIADHLTSFGGQVPDSSQMSIARWLEAGATASYGTVVEPCNYPSKFPDTRVLLPHYFRGETLIEAYWKSVAWPGEGLFAGDPLARPWGTKSVTVEGQSITVETTILDPSKTYEIVSAPAPEGPFELVQTISVAAHRLETLQIAPATEPYYLLREAP